MAILTHFFLLDSITDLILTITFTMRTDDASMTFYELPVCLLVFLSFLARISARFLS